MTLLERKLRLALGKNADGSEEGVEILEFQLQ